MTRQIHVGDIFKRRSDKTDEEFVAWMWTNHRTWDKIIISYASPTVGFFNMLGVVSMVGERRSVPESFIREYYDIEL